MARSGGCPLSTTCIALATPPGSHRPWKAPHSNYLRNVREVRRLTGVRKCLTSPWDITETKKKKTSVCPANLFSRVLPPQQKFTKGVAGFGKFFHTPLKLKSDV